MEICWLGHSCFLLKDSYNTTILTDPFDPLIGYSPYKGKADIVTISHRHYDHCCTKFLKGSPKIIKTPDLTNLNNISIKGLPSYHDNFKGLKRGDNLIFVFKIDNYSLCHLGDLGHSLDNKILDAIGNIDVLFIPVGGNFTIDGETAADLSKKISPKIIIPMHYKTQQVNIALDGIESFLLNMKNGERLNSNTLQLNDNLLDCTNCVKILNYTVK